MGSDKSWDAEKDLGPGRINLGDSQPLEFKSPAPAPQPTPQPAKQAPVTAQKPAAPGAGTPAPPSARRRGFPLVGILVLAAFLIIANIDEFIGGSGNGNEAVPVESERASEDAAAVAYLASVEAVVARTGGTLSTCLAQTLVSEDCRQLYIRLQGELGVLSELPERCAEYQGMLANALLSAIEGSTFQLKLIVAPQLLAGPRDDVDAALDRCLGAL